MYTDFWTEQTLHLLVKCLLLQEEERKDIEERKIKEVKQKKQRTNKIKVIFPPSGQGNQATVILVIIVLENG